MHARTPAARIRPGHDGESEDDDAVWRALRARVEQSELSRHLAQVRRDTALEPDWETLRARAEVRHALELRHAGRGAHAPPALPRRELPMPQQTAAYPPPLLIPLSGSFAVPMTALDEGPDAAFPALARRRQAVPVLLAACIVVGAFGTALVRYLVAEAEQQAQLEAIVREIQMASVQRPASSAVPSSAVRPQAEAPASETLRAFARLSAPPTAPAEQSPKRARRSLEQPSSPDATRTRQPSARPSAKPPQESEGTSEREAGAIEDAPNPSDDPLLGL